jgi:hypothetical protein
LEYNSFLKKCERNIPYSKIDDVRRIIKDVEGSTVESTS